MAFKFQTPQDELRAVAARAKARRLAADLSRRTLSDKAGVSESSLKRFETTGEIGFHSLLKLAFALECMDDFADLFALDPPQSINDLKQPAKRRGSQ